MLDSKDKEKKTEVRQGMLIKGKEAADHL